MSVEKGSFNSPLKKVWAIPYMSKNISPDCREVRRKETKVFCQTRCRVCRVVVLK